MREALLGARGENQPPLQRRRLERLDSLQTGSVVPKFDIPIYHISMTGAQLPFHEIWTHADLCDICRFDRLELPSATHTHKPVHLSIY